jgi:hypothetical protein
MNARYSRDVSNWCALGGREVDLLLWLESVGTEPGLQDEFVFEELVLALTDDSWSSEWGGVCTGGG